MTDVVLTGDLLSATAAQLAGGEPLFDPEVERLARSRNPISGGRSTTDAHRS